MGNKTEEKFSDFINKLESLCRKHGVTLSVSGYDALEIWEYDDALGPIHCSAIDNKLDDEA